jgi:SAM-dependent methyltransferase
MYSTFARFYDRLNTEVDYEKRADYFCRVIDRHFSRESRLLLDLGCGTGSLSFPLARRGWDVIGVDGSGEMLSFAMQKLAAFEGDPRPLFLQQEMERLDLFGTVDICICALDSVNHITDPQRLAEVFQRLSLFVESGGLFIFDANTLYKHRHVLNGSTFVFDEEEVYCVWQNAMSDPCTVEITLDFFERTEGNSYRRSSERFFERAYSTEELQAIGKKAGFELIAVYTADSFAGPKENAQRLVYVMENMTEHRAAPVE